MSQPNSPVSPAPNPEPATLGAGLNFTDPRSPLARYYLRKRHVAAVGLLGLLFLLMNLIPMWHTDVWGHLAFGRWVVENGRLPDRDPLCPFAEDHPTALHAYWLSQTGLYLLYHGGELLAGGDALRPAEGGVQLLRTLHALLVVLRCAALLGALRRLRCPLPLSLVGVAVLLGLSVGHVVILRPQVLGEFFFACLLLPLSRPALSNRALVLVPLLLAVWANCHGSWAVGLILLAAFAFGRSVEACRAARSCSPRAALANGGVRRLLLALATSAAAVAVLNPDGPFIYANTVAMGRHPNVLAMDEWLPLNFAHPHLGEYVYLIVLGLVVLTPLACRRWYSATQQLLLAGFAVQPLLHQRMLLWLLLILPWALLPHWAALGERLPWLRSRGLPSFRKTVLAGLLAVVLLLWSAPAQWVLTGRPWPLGRAVFYGTPWQLAAQLQRPGEPQKAWWPPLTEALRARGQSDGFRGTIFASETLGDYFLWARPADTTVFIYTHVHLFSANHWAECATVKHGLPGWREVLDRHGIDLVVVEPEFHARLRLLLYNDPDWQVVLDETGDPQRPDLRGRLFVAVRRAPAAVEGNSSPRAGFAGPGEE
jgi:hypothetical protein